MTDRSSGNSRGSPPHIFESRFPRGREKAGSARCPKISVRASHHDASRDARHRGNLLAVFWAFGNYVPKRVFATSDK
jgi:hypothetical protein